MIESNEEICVLRERIARLEERLLSSDKALELARSAMSSQWTNVATVIAISVSIFALIMQFYKTTH